jgi:hypothetical protein
METRMVERQEELAQAETRRQVLLMLLLEAPNLHEQWVDRLQAHRDPGERQRDDEAV